jgi:tol-pal system protein YbgF
MPSRSSPAFGILLALVLPIAPLAALGCVHPDTVADRHFAEMRESLAKIEADRDRIDARIGALEVAVADDKAPRGDGPKTPVEPPRVVQLGGPDDEAPDPNDASARPEIRLNGPPGAASVRPRAGKTGGRARIDDAELPGLRADAARSSALDPDAKKSYEAALALVQGKQYAQGLEGLSAFLARWPDHPYAENATYWRGEAYFAQGEYLRAGEQFEAVLTRFGSGNKAPDALLKLGMCQERLGASARAREYWERLKTEYPRSDAAKRIPGTGRDTSKGPKENR